MGFEKRHTSFLTVIVLAASTLVWYPTASAAEKASPEQISVCEKPARLVSRTVVEKTQNGRKEVQVCESRTKTGEIVLISVLVGFAASHAGNYFLSRTYDTRMLIVSQDFLKLSRSHLSGPADKSYFIASYDPKDPRNSWRNFTEPALFARIFKLNPNARFRFVSSPSELAQYLKFIAQNGGRRIRIIISTHGAPGKIGLGNGEIYEAKDFENPIFDGISLPKADVQFFSCNLGADEKGVYHPVGKEFLETFGRRFLANGGTVIAPTRGFVYEGPVGKHLPWREAKLLALEMYLRFQQLVNPSIQEAQDPIAVVSIQPQDQATCLLAKVRALLNH